MKPYEILEHTADIGIIAYGKNPEAVFINAATGMFDIIADTRRIKPREKIEIHEKADSFDELLLQWLRELLYQYSVSGIIPKEFTINKLDSTEIKATARGDKAAPALKAEIKAVTYHELEFRQIATGYQAKVIFDV